MNSKEKVDRNFGDTVFGSGIIYFWWVYDDDEVECRNQIDD